MEEHRARGQLGQQVPPGQAADPMCWVIPLAPLPRGSSSRAEGQALGSSSREEVEKMGGGGGAGDQKSPGPALRASELEARDWGWRGSAE